MWTYYCNPIFVSAQAIDSHATVMIAIIDETFECGVTDKFGKLVIKFINCNSDVTAIKLTQVIVGLNDNARCCGNAGGDTMYRLPSGLHANSCVLRTTHEVRLTNLFI